MKERSNSVVAIHAREYRKAHPEKTFNYHRTHKRKFTNSQIYAKKREQAWELYFEEYSMYMDQGCFYCKKDLNKETGICLDRIDNDLGYIDCNVLPCCGRCNKLRGDYLKVVEMPRIIHLIKEMRDGKVWE